MNRRRVLIGIGGLIVACICLLAVGAILNSTPSGQATATARAEGREATRAEETAVATVEETEADSPTATDIPPTDTAVPEDTPEPTGTPAPDGSSPDSAIPFGSEAEVGDFVLIVNEVERPADTTIESANTFNSDPAAGNEFTLVTLTVTCTKESSERCTFTPLFDLKLFGSSGLVRDVEFGILDVPGQLEQTEFFGGTSITGWVAFEVGQDETGLILAYEPFLGLSRAYLALPEKE